MIPFGRIEVIPEDHANENFTTTRPIRFFFNAINVRRDGGCGFNFSRESWTQDTTVSNRCQVSVHALVTAGVCNAIRTRSKPVRTSSTPR